MKTIIIALLCIISYFSLNFAKDSYRVKNSYHAEDSYHVKDSPVANNLPIQSVEKSIKIQNFPIVLENHNDIYSQQDFNTELFFSDIYKLKIKSNTLIVKADSNQKEINNTLGKNDSLSSNYLTIILAEEDEEHSKYDFFNELFFSDLSRLKTKSPIINTKSDDETIRISNIPVNNGYLSSQFGFRKDPMHGSRRLHKGIDIAAKLGSPVRPLGKGMVVFSGYKFGFGNTVEIKHGKSVLTRYAHLKQFLVDKGQQVGVDDMIGLIGNTGRSTGPHLHLEVLFNGAQVDPQVFLANHFGSRTNTYQVSAKPTEQKINKKIVITKTATEDFPKANNFPQLSYLDYVNSVDGMFGLSAPDDLSQ